MTLNRCCPVRKRFCFVFTVTIVWLSCSCAFGNTHDGVWGLRQPFAPAKTILVNDPSTTAATSLSSSSSSSSSSARPQQSKRSMVNGDDGDAESESSGSSHHDQAPLRPFILENNDDDDDDDPSTRNGPILIVMDAFCSYHGVYLMRRAQEAGVTVVAVLGDYLRQVLMRTEPEQASQWHAMRRPTTEAEALEWKSHLGPRPLNTPIAAVYCESDSGLADAEQLRQLLNVTCRDDPIVLPARRNKFLMNERVAAVTGLATVAQKLCTSVTEAREFAETLWQREDDNEDEDNSDDYRKYFRQQEDENTSRQQQGPRVVVKPVRGVASESVYLCRNAQEVKDAWNAITSTTVFGSPTGAKHDSVLVQEYLRGTEYALDVVSRRGHHKIAAVWKYDKRPANGAPFCYFQTKLVDAVMEPDHVPLIQDHVRQVLDALGIQYGLTHTEVIFTRDDGRGPVLVEVNCRQHNMDFLPIVMACIGYNALDMTLAALLEEENDGDNNGSGNDNDEESVWDLYPENPSLRRFGCMVHLVNFAQGILRRVRYMPEMSELPSFYQGQLYESFQPPEDDDDDDSNDRAEDQDKMIQPTVDIRSDAGWVQLINDDYEQLQRDYHHIVDWMPSMFDVE